MYDVSIGMTDAGIVNEVDSMGDTKQKGTPQKGTSFKVHTDASYTSLGAALVQKIDGVERVISHASRSLANAEKNYSVWELECLAIVWALKLFRVRLASCVEFSVHTDAEAAKHIMEGVTESTNGRTLRWHLAVQEFTFTITKRAGTRDGNADGLDRLPLPSTKAIVGAPQ